MSDASISVVIIEIDADAVGQRVDNFVFARYRSVPKSLIYKGMRKGSFRVNSKRIKPTYRLQLGDLLRVPPLRHTIRQSTKRLDWLEDSIVYEDASMLVVDKPAGLASQGGTGLHFSLIDGMRALREEDTLYLVHRIDRETSGCVVLAKGRQALLLLQQQFVERAVKKRYLALVHGLWQGHSCVDLPCLKVDRRVIIDEEGKIAQTAFKVIESNASWSLLEASPVTGRMHQIRVHCQAVGHPIFGDALYGDGQEGRMFLHALEIEVVSPATERVCVIKSPLPEDKKCVLQERMGGES